MIELEGKKIAIVGAGRTGLAAARFCHARGAKTVINDVRSPAQLSGELKAFDAIHAELRLGGHERDVLSDCDAAIVSPGVSPELEPIRELQERGRPVYGELEFASRYAKAPIIAVTGTNGKSTTVTLIHDMMLASEKRSALGGNIGTPFVELVDQEDDYDVFVIEVSSYQLETIETFRPHIAVLLNITPDHLSRHQNIAAYAATKGRIFSNQIEDDWAVYNADDAYVDSIAAGSHARKLAFSLRRPVSPGLFRQRNQIIWFHEDHQESYDISQYALVGDHQIENAMAAVAAAKLGGATLGGIQDTLDSFRGLPHRFEFIASLRGIHFINDSKATNVGAAVRAIQGVPMGHLILLAGGEDKGASYAPLRQALEERRAKAVCVYGEAAGALQEALRETLPTFRQTTMEEAFSQALAQADDGDFVLLSPACASFDQFSSFEHRGDSFRELVMRQGPMGTEANA